MEFRRRNDQEIEGVFLTKQEMYDYRAKVRAKNALVQVLAARTNTEQASHMLYQRRRHTDRPGRSM